MDFSPADLFRSTKTGSRSSLDRVNKQLSASRGTFRQKVHIGVLLATVALVAYGAIIIWSASQFKADASFSRHLLGIGIGAVLAVLVWRTDLRGISNFSTAAITFCTCLIMLYVGRVRVRELWRLVALVFVTMVCAVSVMYAFNIGRSHTWVNRLGIGDMMSKTEQVKAQGEDDDLQQEQARIAIASGGLMGKGPGNSTQRSNLPHSYSDFAYAFIVEEYGLIGASLMLFLYLCIFFRGIVTFRRCGTAFPGLLVLGLCLMITFQAICNMLVSVCLFPVTGQTLPLVSLGGSSIVFTCLALGLILGISRQVKEESLDRPRKESLLE